MAAGQSCWSLQGLIKWWCCRCHASVAHSVQLCTWRYVAKRRINTHLSQPDRGNAMITIGLHKQVLIQVLAGLPCSNCMPADRILRIQAAVISCWALLMGIHAIMMTGAMRCQHHIATLNVSRLSPCCVTAGMEMLEWKTSRGVLILSKGGTASFRPQHGSMRASDHPEQVPSHPLGRTGPLQAISVC